MSSISQYTQLYRDNAELVNSGSAPALNALRPKALAILEATGSLPTKHTEGFEKTSIEELFAPDYGVNILRKNLPVDLASTFRCDVPRMSTLNAFVVNDSFVPSTDLSNRLPEGVIFCSLAKAAADYPQLITEYYGKLAPANYPTVALNNLLAQDGVFLYIPKGTTIEKPLQIVNIFSSPIPLIAFRRMLIIADDNSKASILLCDHTNDSTQQYLSSQIIEIYAGPGSKIDFYDMEESSPLTSRYSRLFARQQHDSTLLIDGITLANGTTRNDFVIDIAGSHATSKLGGMAIGSGKQHIDNNSQVTHSAPAGQSSQMFKYILDDEATGAFEGGINVNQGAVKTQAYQSNRNLLASADARMHTKPQLLIFCDDVKCSHGATTGQLDQNVLFYMRQRGISEKTAKTMLMQAFMADVIDMVEMEGLRQRLRHLVEKHLHGEAAFCSDCSLTSTEPDNI
ncbi:MAG: Fe-S cluster assembly protein SufD [Muribaculum sp.]|nr:Fe-S cluster assembly protein SufD [Muribaculaceae bacterium]MCM1081253.1 Fe-S cluster assembly protein SufD [Muribaculum sp.]